MAEISDMESGARRRVRSRIGWYCAVALTWAVVWLFTANANWVGFDELHTLFETAAAVVALLISAMAFTRYYSRPESKFLWLAVTFLGAGVLDGVHSALTTWLLALYIPEDSGSTVEWSGYAAHIFIATLLLLSSIGWKENIESPAQQRSRNIAIYAISASLFVTVVAVFAFVPLPHLYQAEAIVSRPANLLPAAIFAAALYLYFKKGEWRESDRRFDHWVIMALICMFAGQAAFLANSRIPLDPYFDIGHLTKLAGYIFILFGLLSSMRGAYEEAEANDRLLRDAVQAVGEGFALYDDQDRLVVFNEAYRRLHPATRDYIKVGMKFEDFVRATVESQTVTESLVDSEAYIARRMERHRNPTAPIVREHNQGPSYIIHESKTSEGWTVVVETEITELKRIESELEEKSKLLESTFNAMADGLSVWDSEHRLLAFNRKFDSLMGRDSDRPFIGMHIRDLFIMNARAGHYGDGDAVDLGTKRYENAMRAPSDARQHISFSGQGTYEIIRNHMDDGSRVTIHRDVSELVAVEQRLSLVIENLAEIFVLWDADDRLVTTNRRFRELNSPIMDICVPGLSYEEFMRTGVERGMFPGAEEDAEAWIANRIEEHRNPSVPKEVARQDGQWLLIQEQKLTDGGVVTVGSDITELKRV